MSSRFAETTLIDNMGDCRAALGDVEIVADEEALFAEIDALIG